LTTTIKLVNSKKLFLADFTKMQPIEPIIKECYRQFKLPIPRNPEPQLYFLAPGNIKTILDHTDYNKRYGAYNLPGEVELVFEP